MIRRLNYTGRRKISRSRVNIRLQPGADGLYSFDVDFDLTGFGFPEESSVFVEAYNATSYMRFAFGTLGRRRDPPDSRLRDITPRPLPKFRLKVVDRTERHGRLLGVADKLIPLRPDEEPANKQSLLPVDFVDLGERVWRLELSDWPVLELNKRVEGIGEMARSGDAFLALVYPEAIRRILHDIVVEQDLTDIDFDDTEWTCLWLRYICQLPGVGAPPAGSSEDARGRKQEWIDEAVQAFCRSRQARQRFKAAVARSES
jgi:hypothetical protein